jgi:hypothetical protein
MVILFTTDKLHSNAQEKNGNYESVEISKRCGLSPQVLRDVSLRREAVFLELQMKLNSCPHNKYNMLEWLMFITPYNVCLLMMYRDAANTLVATVGSSCVLLRSSTILYGESKKEHCC